MLDTFISLQGVSRSFGTRHPGLRACNLNLRAKECVGLVGCSGAGKSTLLKLLLALDHCDNGRIFCQGQQIIPASSAKLRWYRRLVQYVPQDAHASLNPRHNVAQLIAEPLRQLTSKRNLAPRVEWALRQVELDGQLLHARPGELSGGQAQRVALARAIAPQPRFLLADEPVSGLDLPLRQQIISLLANISQRQEMGLLVVSHDLSLVSRLCQRTLVMDHGVIVEDRPTAELLRTPRHCATQALIAAIPSVPYAC